MTKKYHINNSGDVRICEASIQSCEFGSEQAHYSSPELAAAAYELSMAGREFQSTSKNKSLLNKSWVMNQSGYENLRKNATAVIDFSDVRHIHNAGFGSTHTHPLKEIHQQWKDLPVDTPVAVRLYDGTVIIDSAGNGLIDSKAPNRLERITLPVGFVNSNGGLSLHRSQNLHDVATVQEVLVLKDSPELPEDSESPSDEAVYMRKDGKFGEYAIYTPDYHNSSTAVSTAIAEHRGEGRWEGGFFVRTSPHS